MMYAVFCSFRFMVLRFVRWIFITLNHEKNMGLGKVNYFCVLSFHLEKLFGGWSVNESALRTSLVLSAI